MCMAMFFLLNGYQLRFADSMEEEDFVVDIVKHRYTLEGIATILEKHTAEFS